MLNTIKISILFIIFCSSSLAAINDCDIVSMRWECAFCKRKYTGKKPPNFQRCLENRESFDVWILKSVVTKKFDC